MVNKFLVSIIGSDPLVERMFEDTGITDVRVLENPLKEAEGAKGSDLVVFTGGSDVTPWLYGRKNTASVNNVNRDIREVLWFHRFINTPKVGICRGGQFLFTMNGGVMEQDIPGHGFSHQLVYNVWQPPGDIKNSVTSTHHQHMAHLAAHQTLLASAKQDAVHEVVWSASTKSLSFQPHPEYEDMECRKLFFWYVEKLFKYRFMQKPAAVRAFQPGQVLNRELVQADIQQAAVDWAPVPPEGPEGPNEEENN